MLNPITKIKQLNEGAVFGEIEVYSTFAELSQVSGDGLKSAIINEKQNFKVTTMNRYGKCISEENTLKVQIKNSEGLENSSVEIENQRKYMINKFKKIDDGTYEVSYIPKSLGQHTIEIFIGNMTLKDSPFILQAFAKREYKGEQRVYPIKIGGYGSKQREFKSPIGITSTDQQEIFICDSYNHRIRVI